MTDSPQGVKATERPWRQSHEAMRLALAREIWRYMECPWDFDNPDSEMGKLQKQLALDQAEGLRKVILENAVFAAAFAHMAPPPHDTLRKALEEAREFVFNTISGEGFDPETAECPLLDKIDAALSTSGAQ